MGDITIKMPRLHAGQREIKNDGGRFKVVACGRRFGKDVLQNDIILQHALEGKSCLWCTPTYRDLMRNWDELKEVLHPVITKAPSDEMKISLITGGFIDFFSLEKPDRVRGNKYHVGTINEAGYVKDLVGIFDKIIRATLADYSGAMYFCGTPNGRNGFYDLYQRGLQGIGGWSSFTKSSYENPHILPAELDAIKASVPEIVFNQEFLGMFVDAEGLVFRRVRDCVNATWIEKPLDGHFYRIAVDVASEGADYNVCTVMDAESNELVYYDRFNRCDAPVTEDRIIALCARFNVKVPTVEKNGIGKIIIDHLRQKGMAVMEWLTTNTTKHEAITALQSDFEHGLISIPDDRELLSELLSFESKKTAAGNMTYSAPSGLHDDIVMSLAINNYQRQQVMESYAENPFYD